MISLAFFFLPRVANMFLQYICLFTAALLAVVSPMGLVANPAGGIEKRSAGREPRDDTVSLAEAEELADAMTPKSV